MKNKIQPSRRGLTRRNAMVALCALIMVIVVCPSMIGGTLAYLKQVTPKIENTFELGELTYVLNFDANPPGEHQVAEVSGMPEDHKYEETVAAGGIVCETEAPVLTGYTFMGWADSEDAEKADYSLDETTQKYPVSVDYGDGTYIDGTTTKTVYAVWQPIAYTVEYKANADTGTPATGSTANSVHTYDVPQNLTKNGYTRTGYNFMGWNTQPDGSGTSYIDNEMVKNLSSTSGDKIVLYAQWIPSTQYVITYYANADDAKFSNQQKVYQESKVIDTPYTIKDVDTLGLTRTDYWTFAGWSTDKESEDPEYLANNVYDENANLTLYAIWRPAANVKFGPVHFVNMTNTSSSLSGYTFTMKCTTQSGADGIAIAINDLIPGEAYRLQFNVQLPGLQFYTEDNHAYMFGTTIIDKYQNYDTQLSIIARDGVKETSTYENMLWSTEKSIASENVFLEFVATDKTMYWFWETTDIQDNKSMTYTFKDFSISRISKPSPRVEFENLRVTYETAPSKGLSIWTPASEPVRHKNYFHVEQFDFDYLRYRMWGTEGHERMRIPISGLEVGKTYKLSFNQNLGNAQTYNSTPYYGAVISAENDLNVHSIPSATGYQDLRKSIKGNSSNHEFVFTATKSTMYWYWTLGDIKDGMTSKVYSWVTLSNVKISETTAPVMLTMDNIANTISNLTVTGAENFIVGEPCVLTLSGEGLPDILQVDVSGAKYMMSLNGGDIESFAASMGANVQNDWVAANEDGSCALTIPAELVVEGTTITLSGYDATSLDMITIGTFTPAA